LKCPHCKNEKLIRSDQLKRLTTCSCNGNVEEIREALKMTFNVSDPRIDDFLHIYVLGKSKADAVLLSGIIEN